MVSEKVREVQERRRSSAASPITRTRRMNQDDEIEEQLDDADWLYGNSPAGLRMRAAEELAKEFGTSVEEWLL